MQITNCIFTGGGTGITFIPTRAANVTLSGNRLVRRRWWHRKSGMRIETRNRGGAA